MSSDREKDDTSPPRPTLDRDGHTEEDDGGGDDRASAAREHDDNGDADSDADSDLGEGDGDDGPDGGCEGDDVTTAAAVSGDDAVAKVADEAGQKNADGGGDRGRGLDRGMRRGTRSSPRVVAMRRRNVAADVRASAASTAAASGKSTTTSPTKRKRGRPRKSQPTSVVAKGKVKKRKRGRPRKSSAPAPDSTTTPAVPSEILHTILFDSGTYGEEMGMDVSKMYRGGGGGCCVVRHVVPGGHADRLGARDGDVVWAISEGRSEDEHMDDDGIDRNDEDPSPVKFEHFLRLSDRRPLRVTLKRSVGSSTDDDDEEVVVVEDEDEHNNRKRRRRRRRVTVSEDYDDYDDDENDTDDVRVKKASAARDAAALAKSRSAARLARAKRALDKARAAVDEAESADVECASRLREAESTLEARKVLRARPGWDDMFERLVKFKERHGHTWVKKPRSGKKRKLKGGDEEDEAEDDERDGGGDHVDEAAAHEESDCEDEAAKERRRLIEEKFRRWVGMQRDQYRQYRSMKDGEGAPSSKRITMTADRAAKLRDIGFMCTVQEYRDGYEWDVMYGKLVEFRRERGHVNVPQNNDMMPLARWVERQQKQFAEGNLSQEKIDSLNKLQFSFEVRTHKRLDGQWDDMLARLRTFKDTYGHCCVPGTWEEDQTLSNWVKQQRVVHAQKKPHNGKLSLHRYEALNELGFIWNVREAQWDHWLIQLADYKEKFGDCNVKRVPGPYYRLAHWVKKLRWQYTRLQDGQHTELTPDRIERLEALGFQWKVLPSRQREATSKTEEEMWSERYQQLREFHAEHGHCRGRFRDGLTRWMTQMRQQYREFRAGRPSTITDERIRLLKEVDFDLTPRRTK